MEEIVNSFELGVMEGLTSEVTRVKGWNNRVVIFCLFTILLMVALYISSLYKDEDLVL